MKGGHDKEATADVGTAPELLLRTSLEGGEQRQPETTLLSCPPSVEIAISLSLK